MFDVVVLAVALSMDAFAVSIGLGSKPTKRTRSLAMMAALYFGIAQGIMPLIGYLGGTGVMSFVSSYADWVAFTLLALIGGKMIYESMSEGVEESIQKITHKMMLALAIATSIDAMAAGFSLTLIDVHPIAACGIIGLTTCVFCWLGVHIGRKNGVWLESKAELAGGITLIAIGLKILLW